MDRHGRWNMHADQAVSGEKLSSMPSAELRES